MNIKFGDKICINLNNSKKTDFRNIPWCGNLDEIEVHRPGGLLMAALIRHANEHQIQLNELAKELGVTYGYINQLRKDPLDRRRRRPHQRRRCRIGHPAILDLVP